jgi:hypothetical protein
MRQLVTALPASGAPSRGFGGHTPFRARRAMAERRRVEPIGAADLHTILASC